MKTVLFVCIGNSIRSQMAEAFTRAYGADVLKPTSAGLFPASAIAPLTRRILYEKNVSLDGHFPKRMEDLMGRFDIVVNMSGEKLAINNVPVARGGRLIEWSVRDPMGMKETAYREAASQIEELVMRLILEERSVA